MAKVTFERLLYICQQENISVPDKAVLAKLVKRFFPDIRRMINEIQRYGMGGTLDSTILASFSDASFNELVEILRDKKFNDLRKWVASHADGEPTAFFHQFFETMGDVLEPKAVAQAVLLLADYQYKSAFAADQQINTLAFLTEVMASCSIKAKG